MRKTWTGIVVAALFLFLGVTTASAVPIISVDMDNTMAGIQNTLNVTPGTTFTVDVVIDDDGNAPSPTTFDTVILEMFFNDSVSVLSPGPTGPVAGALAGNSIFTASLFGPLGPLVPGTTVLGTGPSSAPAGGFAGGSGAIGLFDFLSFTVTPGSPTTIFSMDFTAGVLGFPSSSQILAAGTGPFGSPELALGGNGIAAILAPGTVNVGVSVALPTPGTLALLLPGLTWLAVWYRRRRTQGQR